MVASCPSPLAVIVGGHPMPQVKEEEGALAAVTVVVVAGNSNANACNYSPAAEPSAITGEYHSRFYLTSNLFHCGYHGGGIARMICTHTFVDFLFCSLFELLI